MNNGWGALRERRVNAKPWKDERVSCIWMRSRDNLWSTPRNYRTERCEGGRVDSWNIKVLAKKCELSPRIDIDTLKYFKQKSDMNE